MGRIRFKFSVGLNNVINPLSILPINIFYYSQKTMGVRKMNSFIKIRPGNCTPEFFIIGSNDTLFAITPNKEIKVQFSDILSHRIPRILLRPKYQSIFDKGSKEFHSFDSFSDMVINLKIIPGELIGIEDYGFDATLINDIIEGKCDHTDYNIFLCLLFRINTINKIIKDKKYNTKQELHNLYLFLDTHIELSRVIIQKNLYKDEELKSIDNNLHPIYKEYYPHDMRFFDHSDSPCIWQIIYSSGDKIPETEKKKTESIFTILTQKVFTKIGVYTCQKRCISKVILGYMKTYKDIEKLIRRICFISILGNIDWVLNRPNFKQRMEIYEYFLTKETNIEHFIKSMGNTLLFIMREFLIYFKKNDYVLNLSTKNDFKWKNIKENVLECMSKIREVIIETSELFSVEQIEKILNVQKHYYTICLDYGSKLNKVLPEIFFYNKIEEFHKKNIIYKYNKNEIEDIFYIKRETLYRIKAISQYIYQTGAMHLNNFFQTRWLKYLGIGDDSYFYIRKIFYQYCCLDRADNSITKKVKKLYDKGQYDFHLIRIYLSELVNKYKYIQYRLPQCIIDKQINSHKRKMNYITKVSEREFNTNCVNYYCPVCNKWAASVIKPLDKNGLKSICSCTPKFCATDMCTDKLVCIRPSGVTKSIQYLTRSNNNKKKKRNIDSKNIDYSAKCYETELVPVNMIGIIQKLNGKNYVRCTICDSIMEFDSSRFNTLGLNCGNHMNYKFEKSLMSTITDINNSIKCFYCNNRNTEKRTKNNVTSLIVIDDEDKDNLHLKNIFICEGHKESVRYLTPFPLLSNVILQIQTYGSRFTRRTIRERVKDGN